MKKTLKRSWQRVRSRSGMLYYWHPVSDYVICQVWKEGSRWEWAIVGFLMNHRQDGYARPPFIWKRGSGGTMNEACWYCELALPDEAYEQMAMVLPTAQV